MGKPQELDRNSKLKLITEYQEMISSVLCDGENLVQNTDGIATARKEALDAVSKYNATVQEFSNKRSDIQKSLLDIEKEIKKKGGDKILAAVQSVIESLKSQDMVPDVDLKSAEFDYQPLQVADADTNTPLPDDTVKAEVPSEAAEEAPAPVEAEPEPEESAEEAAEPEVNSEPEAEEQPEAQEEQATEEVTEEVEAETPDTEESEPVSEKPDEEFDIELSEISLNDGDQEGQESDDAQDEEGGEDIVESMANEEKSEAPEVENEKEDMISEFLDEDAGENDGQENEGEDIEVPDFLN